MAELVASGSWVEIHSIVLSAEQRAVHIPENTKGVALEMRVKGFLVGAAALGDQVEIVTLAGRRISGTLAAIHPSYAHGFGAPIAALQAIGGEIKTLLRASGAIK